MENLICKKNTKQNPNPNQAKPNPTNQPTNKQKTNNQKNLHSLIVIMFLWSEEASMSVKMERCFVLSVLGCSAGCWVCCSHWSSGFNSVQEGDEGFWEHPTTMESGASWATTSVQAAGDGYKGWLENTAAAWWRRYRQSCPLEAVGTPSISSQNSTVWGRRLWDSHSPSTYPCINFKLLVFTAAVLW